MESIDSIMEKVREIMAKEEFTRNSDLALLIQFWREVDGAKIEFPTSRMSEITKAESIIRCRRKIQHEGFLPPTDPEIISKRFAKAEGFKWAMRRI